MSGKNIRQIQGQNTQDPSSIAALEFNAAAGSQKVSEVGRALLPMKFINSGAVVYTTDASTARVLDSLGKCLAIYNNSGSLGSVVLGASAAEVATVLAAGVTDSTGHVGVPCMPNAWTYLACNNYNWIKSSASTLLVFVVDDETSIKQEAKY
jgi:hypothetical protein